jgi:hypothetical protein
MSLPDRPVIKEVGEVQAPLKPEVVEEITDTEPTAIEEAPEVADTEKA